MEIIEQKIIDAIKSCKTKEQFELAENWAHRVWEDNDMRWLLISHCNGWRKYHDPVSFGAPLDFLPSSRH